MAANIDDGKLGKNLNELVNHGENDPKELLKHRFLCRGGVLALIGPTGVGKSSLSMQMMIQFALGKAAFGIIPTRELKSLLVQAENDDGDLAEMRDGVFKGLDLSEEDNILAGANIIVHHEDSKAGDAFFELLERLLEQHGPDILWIDPVLAYLGGDVLSQKDVGEFLRNKLLPLLNKYLCACVIIHHTNKTGNGKDAYAGSGSAEFGNMPRAILVLIAKGEGKFIFAAVKRGFRLRWKKADGITKTIEKGLKHSDADQQICWHESNSVESESEKDKIQNDVETIRELLSNPNYDSIFPMEKAPFIGFLNANTKIGQNKLHKLVPELIQKGILIKTEEPRKNARPAIWISIPKESKAVTVG